MRALLASGAGRYCDAWHPFSRTSALLAEVLEGAGFAVDVDEDVDAAMERLADVDLLVVNAGDPWRDDRAPLPMQSAGAAALSSALDAGIGVLALHCAVASLRDYPSWALALGAVWVPGASWHPPLDRARIHGAAFVDGDPVADFDVVDERYLRLQRIGDSHVVAWHDGELSPEPTAWIRHFGASRIAVDVLGHDERSYQSSGHRRLISQLARWAASADRDS